MGYKVQVFWEGHKNLVQSSSSCFDITKYFAVATPLFGKWVGKSCANSPLLNVLKIV